MGEILSKCGYRCDLCPAYKENLKNEEDKIAVSKGWERIFGFHIPPEEVECAGCHNNGNHPDSGCPVRPCAIEKGVENCAFCKEFECNSLKSRTGFLDEFLKAGIKIPEEDYQRFVVPYESKERLQKLFKDLSN